VADQRRQRHERVGELTQSRLRRGEAALALKAATARLVDLAVRAPADGLVAEISVKPGDRPLAGVPLVKLATVNPMVVDVDVAPRLVNAIKRGDAAIVRLSESGQEYPGRIRTIAPLPGEAGAHALEVEFENPTAALLSGRTAKVRLSLHH
jgi:multidrug resistance efflux pump